MNTKQVSNLILLFCAYTTRFLPIIKLCITIDYQQCLYHSSRRVLVRYILFIYLTAFSRIAYSTIPVTVIRKTRCCSVWFTSYALSSSSWLWYSVKCDFIITSGTVKRIFSVFRAPLGVKMTNYSVNALKECQNDSNPN